MMWHQILQACVIVFLGSVLQGAVGFGIGLFSIPILIWVGVPIEATVALITVVSGFQTLWSWRRTRQSMNWRLPVPMTLVRILFLPLGIVALGVLSDSGQRTIKQIVGGIIIAILLTQWLLKIKPRQRLAIGWMWLAGSISGFLTGLINMGGPPLVMWVMAHDWPSRQARTFLWLSFLMATPLMLLLLWAQFGNAILLVMGVGALLTPFVVAGSVLGLWAGNFMSRVHLRVAMTILLTIIAVTSLVG